ncbi:hypothetical protein [Carnimonas nigrificans]|uniref:hypothetical protein n=1 Tax=Carnimonas nigrificans TaxID=64323 RepID=UPI0004AC6C33|nr:hypothetical protein [Carnimonas nigrificans]
MIRRLADFYDWMKARSYVDALFNWLIRLLLTGGMIGWGWSRDTSFGGVILLVVGLAVSVPLIMQAIDGSAYLFKKLRLFHTLRARVKSIISGLLGLGISALVALSFASLIVQLLSR